MAWIIWSSKRRKRLSIFDEHGMEDRQPSLMASRSPFNSICECSFGPRLQEAIIRSEGAPLHSPPLPLPLPSSQVSRSQGTGATRNNPQTSACPSAGPASPPTPRPARPPSPHRLQRRCTNIRLDPHALLTLLETRSEWVRGARGTKNTPLWASGEHSVRSISQVDTWENMKALKIHPVSI